MRDVHATAVRRADTLVEIGQGCVQAALRIDGLVGVALDVHGADGAPIATVANRYLDAARVERYVVSGFRTDPCRAAAIAAHAPVLGRDMLPPRAVRELAAEYGCPDNLCRHVLVAPVPGDAGVVAMLRAIALHEPPPGARDALGAVGAQLGIRLASIGVSTAPRHSELTSRQREVAALIARGYTNDGIARALDVSINTVKKHVAVMLDALGAANRAELAALADRADARVGGLDPAAIAPDFQLVRAAVSPSRERSRP